MLVLTILLVVAFVNDVANAASGVLPVDTALKALVYAFASLTVHFVFLRLSSGAAIGLSPGVALMSSIKH